MEESRFDRIQRFALMHSTARTNAGKSQEFMAAELGVSKKTIQNWEKGVSSPSFFQSLEWFRVLDANPFPAFLSFIYPSQLKDLKGSDNDEKIEEAFATLMNQISINDKRAFLFFYKGDHGSSPHSLIQLLLAHLHTPLHVRIANAYLVSHEYSLHKQLGTTICNENIQPDMDDLSNAILKAQESVMQNGYGYTNIDKSIIL